ncbi:ABC transporter substrate-binding protein [Pseudomonas typographi]|uniref:ABC transporter substrate-binding protein n=1 Tax=Pseudomonas typographi TaxID=2715964 RepID=A0ABR7Z0L4_9PSED|nr:ABC transporter substrate-binding protein [Pseudomonas typographi]MBD1550686.1 ABC transporter substrate-binding protein [Pseudomonas typographi]MBD1589295.1 ABC transporter substrate-binding protein [Pseudomonas typographi]MBD1598972.1 ABC transporter substrate-binding protein [Pseudomonas typographi]
MAARPSEPSVKPLIVLASTCLATVLSLASYAQTLVVGDQSYNARTVMEAAGVLEDLPYTLEWKQFSAGSPVAEALNAGSLDLGLLGDAPPLFLGALGAPLKVVAVSRQQLDGVAIVVRGDSGIQRVEDLRGKRAAVWKGSWSQQLLFSALDRAKVPRDAVDLRYLNALDAAHALDGGSVDAIATWEPYVTQAVRHGARVLCTAEGLIPAQSFVVASDSAIAGKRAAIADFLARLRTARQWSLQSPAHTEQYANAWAERTRADADIARVWFAHARTDLVPVDARAISDAQQTIDFFAGLGQIHSYPAARIFDPSFGAALAPDVATAP